MRVPDPTEHRAPRPRAAPPTLRVMVRWPRETCAACSSPPTRPSRRWARRRRRRYSSIMSHNHWNRFVQRHSVISYTSSIRKCLESIQNQTYQNYTVVVVDDGHESPDFTTTLCDEFDFIMLTHTSRRRRGAWGRRRLRGRRERGRLAGRRRGAGAMSRSGGPLPLH